MAQFRLGARAFVALQWLLPTRLLSSIVHWIAHIETPWFRRLLIHRFMRSFDISLDDAQISDADAFPHFNAFFTRALHPSARPLPDDGVSIISPVDGTVSEAGRLEGHRLLQAKGMSYTADELLGEPADAFTDGTFCTIYLAPSNYHRIHAPMPMRLTGWRYVPGRLFSVNPTTVSARARLFARNERVVAFFETAHGPIALVMVGALFVGSVDTVWAGRITPPHSRSSGHMEMAAATFARGDEIARFNMGSTVIILAAAGALQFTDDLAAGTQLRMGRTIARSPA